MQISLNPIKCKRNSISVLGKLLGKDGPKFFHCNEQFSDIGKSNFLRIYHDQDDIKCIVFVCVRPFLATTGVTILYQTQDDGKSRVSCEISVILHPQW